jgi:peptide/nickel transport system substrate-binding protein
MHLFRRWPLLVIVLAVLTLIVPNAFAGGTEEAAPDMGGEAEMAMLSDDAIWSVYSTPALYRSATGASVGSFKEAPGLADQVAAGSLESVSQRLPNAPFVLVPTDSIGQYGGTLRRTWMGPSDMWGINKPIGERFLTWSNDSQVVPNVPESFEVVDGGTGIIFHLREGMKWSDGHPLTTADVAFYVNDIKFYDPLKTVQPQEWDNMEFAGERLELTIIDDYTFRLDFAIAAAETFLRQRAMWGPSTMLAPAHYLEQYHANYTPVAELNAMAAAEGFNDWSQLFALKNDYLRDPDRPVIYAWMPVNTQNDTVFRFERNPYYWKVDPEGNQLPYVDNLEVTLVEDRQVVVLKAVSGEIDFQARHLVMSDYPVLAGESEQSGYDVYRYTTDMAADPVYRLNHTTDNLMLRELFSDLRFKQALSLAVNRPQLNELSFLDLGEPRQASFVTGSPFYDASWESAYAEFDPDRANALLDEIGLPVGSDGLRRYNGEVVNITLTYTRDEDDQAMELTKSWWEEIGIGVSIRKLERSLFEERFQNNDTEINVWYQHKMLRPDVELFYLVPSGPTHAYYGPLWSAWFASDGTTGLEPPDDVKRLFEIRDALEMAPSWDERLALMEELGNILEENLFFIGTVGESPQPVVVSKNLRNVPRQLMWTGLYRNGGYARMQQFYFDDE